MTGTSGIAKVSDIIAEQLALHGCNVIFGVSGGASLHLLQSIIDHPKLRLITVHHEQTVAMAAEAYSRITGKMGVGVVTSGPGATNLTTGIAGAYFDSVPCLFLTGQVSTFRRSKGLGVRQYGFQETPTSQIFQSITKRVIEIEDANQVFNAMSEAFMVALEGRPVIVHNPFRAIY
jgi:acetolactate synthase-1/2/3 large subunit